MDDTRMRIIFATMKAVRQYGLEGTRIQTVSDLAGVSPGALYRYFDSKDQLIVECFNYVDQQAAAIFEHLMLNPLTMLTDPMEAVRRLWSPYFRFWVAHPDETVFYHRFRDSAFFQNTTRPGISPISIHLLAWSGFSSGLFPRWSGSTRTCCGFIFSHRR